MKSPLLLILAFYTTSSFSAVTPPRQCTDTEKQNNIANNTIILLNSYNGPIKSITMTSTLPDDGRFKALKGEIKLDECGNLLKDSTSMQEYVEGNVETNLIRTSPDNPYVIRYQFQIKNPQRTHSIYMQETYSKDEQNRLNKKITQYYTNDGVLIETDISRFDYKDGRIIKEISTSSSPDQDVITTQYAYNAQGKLVQVIEDKKLNVEYQYDDKGKVIKQANYIKGMYDEDKAFITTCLEWDTFNNCSKEQLESTIKYGDEIINYSKAMLYNEFTYYE
ncbi:hypothetical protein [Proteus sp. FME41]|uniref:hypothetical protein n=1 Tax=Proteus sp. FME41 TaxID=2742608 RepID=UPI0018679ABE|nr:hypothetical protein [Proteus sp. FME41]